MSLRYGTMLQCVISSYVRSTYFTNYTQRKQHIEFQKETLNFTPLAISAANHEKHVVLWRREALGGEPPENGAQGLGLRARLKNYTRSP